MTAVYGAAASGASGSGYSQSIDVSTLTPGGKTNEINLPAGAVGNTYVLSLKLTGCHDNDTFSWTLEPGSRASIAQGGGTNQSVTFSLNELSDSDKGKKLQATVQLTETTATPPVTYTLLFDVAVNKYDPISLAPNVLMSVTVGAAYTQDLVTHGGSGNFTWSVTTSLPPGLTWDASNHKLSGTVTDSTQVGKAFSLVVKLAASDVIMDPLTIVLGVTVQSAPAVASDMPLWETILLYAAAPTLVTMTAIIAFAIYRYKAGKANAKTAEATGRAIQM